MQPTPHFRETESEIEDHSCFPAIANASIAGGIMMARHAAMHTLSFTAGHYISPAGAVAEGEQERAGKGKGRGIRRAGTA